MAYENDAFEKDSFRGSSSEEEDADREAYSYVRERNRAKGWDVFRSTEAEAGSASEANTDLIEFFYKALKVVTIGICFLVVLGSSVIAKGATFFMVSQASNEDKFLELCSTSVPSSSLEQNFDRSNVTFYAVNTKIEKVSWLWCIFFSFAATELFTFLRSLRITSMRSNTIPHIFDFSVVMLFETFHVVGVALLFYVAFPSMDSLRGIMITHAVAIFPTILKLFKKDEGFEGKKMKIVARALTGISLLIQISALVIWPVLDINKKEIPNVWALPLGLFLTSFGWWESFVEEDSIKPLKLLWLLKTKMTDGGSRFVTYTVISLWKTALFFGALLIIAPVNQVVDNVDFLFTNFQESFRRQQFIITFSNTTSDNNQIPYGAQSGAIHPMWVLFIQIAFSYLAHIFGKFACKCGIQWQCFALPLNLVVPVCMSTLIPMCVNREKNPCIYGDGTSGGIPPNLFFECPKATFNENWLVDYHTWIWVLWFLSQIWITIHAWRPRNRRLASTEQLFGTPFYNSLLLEQSMLLNRRSDNGEISRRFFYKHKQVKEAADLDDVDDTEVKPKARKVSALSMQKSDLTEDGDIRTKDSTSRVMGCATMWHENAEEITEMLKSIFRIDEDYSARFLAKKILDIDDPDFYEWQTHIFFDDCMELCDDPNEPDEQQANQFVRLLVKMVDIVGKKWYGSRNLKVPYPVKYPTPYGGRLVWTLPGKTQIICHLKDKNKIRHKKRWSQIMYMYYFLGHQLMDNPRLTAAQKDVRAENTYLLALDGDVDFQPDAIIKLVDLMKRNPDVGASCGRIHPTGSGFMQWYQMFEYAIGHWFQKATEHIMGCVLCSPGCFSLFRAKAIMDDNVMNTYTTVATQPRHYVQYDQGEDRWLCTLLLQQGWRVEYSAASDSFTACPEGFKEFYNQRRRWMPSTIANIADLLQDWRRVVGNNDNISIFFIAYQVMMMIGTVLGPGSILLMLVGAFNVAFRISNDNAMIINCLLVGVFIAACILLKSDHQIAIALLLSVAYALIMMAVLVGMILQMREDGWLAPTTLSFLFIAACFILAGILHPQEFACLPMGVIYYITVPSMYLLLVIYSIFNLNNVSWGTREVPKKVSQQEQEEQQKNAIAQKEAAKKGSGLLGYFTSIAEKKKKGNMEISFGNIFSCLCFTTEDQTDPKKELLIMADKLDKIEKALRIQEPERNTLEAIRGAVSGTTTFMRKVSRNEATAGEEKKEDSEPENENDNRRGSEEILKVGVRRRPTVRIAVEEPKRDDMVNPFWIEDPNLGDGQIKRIPRHEVIFWNEMVEKYLKPLDKNPEKEKQVAEGLKELRNQSAFSFIMLNAIWVILIYLLQKEKDMLNVPWPYTEFPPNISIGGTDVSERNTIHITKKVLELEPLGFVFMIFFGFVMLVQLIGMLMHRIMTISHIVASTHIRVGKKAPLVGDDYLAKNGVNMVKEWQNNYQGGDESGEQVSLETAVEKTLSALTSDDPNLLRRVSDIDQMSSNMPSLNRTETKAALKRRNTAHLKRKATRKASRRRKPETETIQEEDETDSRASSFYEKIPVDRTKSVKDPNGLIERDV